MIDRLFDVENRAHVAADLFAIVNRHRGVRAAPPLGLVGPWRASVERHVDKDPQHPAGRLAPELNVENLETV